MGLKLPEIYKSKIQHKLDKISDIGQGKIVEWSGYDLFDTVFYTYLCKKYKTNCYINTLYLKITNTNQKQIAIHVDLEKCINSIYNCINSGLETKIILIPFSTIEVEENKGHANLLIFRNGIYTLEHFEPHGVRIPMFTIVNSFLKNFVIKLSEKLNNQVKLIQSDKICPKFIGVQKLESNSKLPKNTNGFCLVWSIFFAELVLKNPNLTSEQITKLIVPQIQFNNTNIDMWSNYFRNLITGYTLLLDEKIVKYLSKYYGEELTISKLIQLFKNTDNKSRDLLRKIRADFSMFVIGEKYKRNEQTKIFENISSISKSISSHKLEVKNITSKNKTEKQKISRCPNGEKKIK